jgi:competence protein ComEC
MRRFILGFVSGVAYVQTWAILPAVWLCCVPVLLSALLLVFAVRSGRGDWSDKWFGKTRLVSGAVIVSGVLAGLVWAALSATIALYDSLPKDLEGKDVTVIGVVDSLPETLGVDGRGGGTRFVFKVDEVIRAPGSIISFPHTISLTWYNARMFAGKRVPNGNAVPIIQPGERWQLNVKLKRPHSNANPMGFDSELRALEQGIRATGYVRDSLKSGDRDPYTNLHTNQQTNKRLQAFVWSAHAVVGRLRFMLRNKISTVLAGQPFAGVMTALVVGDQKAILPASWDVFRQTGVSHLVAISGLHITLVAGTLASLFAALWRRSLFMRWQLPLLIPVPKVRALAACIVAWGYVALAGFGVPAQRALYMLMVVVGATWFARRTPISVTLLLALFVVVLFDPWAVLSAGFWLSFSAVGVIVYASAGRPARARYDRDRYKEQPRLVQRLYHWWQSIRAGASTQYAVTLGLLPMTMVLFGQYSLVSPLANAIAIPAVTLLVAPLALIGAVMPSPLSDVLLRLAHLVFEYVFVVLGYLAQLPYAVWTTPLPSAWLFVFGMAGVVIMLAPKGLPVRWVGCLGCLPLLLNTATAPAHQTVWLTAFDIGQGMGVLVETAHHRLLYDTGPAMSEEMDSGKRIILPYLAARGITHLDTLVVSHSDNDHVGGALSVMAGVDVDEVRSSLDAQHPVVQAAKHASRCERGQHWEWDGVQFMFLHPTGDIYQATHMTPNAHSCVLRIATGHQVALLAGDIEAPQEKALLQREYPETLHADVLLVPHHGSGTSSTQAFLQAVNPSVALFQMGYLNRFHHPKPIVWERYGELGVQRLRSDTDGAVEITMDGQGKMTVAPYRQTHARYWYGR